jgi:phosphoesterase RecJ-like protein
MISGKVRHPEAPEDLVQFIKSGESFLIAGHKEPDGDCVGSQLALRSLLLRLGKKAIVCSAGPFKRAELKNYSGQFVDIDTVKNNKNIKVIVIDCSGMERTGSLQETLEKYPCAVIDHHDAVTHPKSTPEAPVYVDPHSPSCTLLIEKLTAALGLEPTKEEAELLLFGLCTDTGFFRHLTKDDAYVLEASAKMLRCGASLKKIYQIMNGGKSLNSRILMGHILSRIEEYFGGRLLISYETLEEFNSFGYEARDSDSINKMLLSIEGVEATAVIRQEMDNNCTVSLRSADNIDVSQIASSLGGGGHVNASGLTIKGNITNVKQIILKAFSKIFI